MPTNAKYIARYLATFLSMGLFGAVFFVPVARADNAPVVVLGQGQVPATSTDTSNGVVDERQVFVGNGYSGPVGSITIALQIGHDGSPTETAFAGAFTAAIYQASTSAPIGTVDATCQFAASSTDFASGSGFPAGSGFLQMHPISETNGGCTLRPDWYTAVEINVYRSHFVNSYWSDYSYGSTINNQGWNWAHSAFTGIDCANYWNGVGVQNICYSQGTSGTGFYPNFSVLGLGFQLVPSQESTGVFFSGAVAFCNDAFASSSGIGSTIGNGLCVATGYLFIPTAASVAGFTGIPNQISQSFPFSYITQIRGLLEAANASSSDAFIDLNLPLGTSTAILGFTNLDVISTSTISHFMPDSTRNLIKGLLTAVFYLAAAGFIYRSLQGIWSTT